MPNALFALSAYFKDGLWMFDDPLLDIYEEPFVAGADMMFDVMSGRINNPKIHQCSIVFAATPIPNSDVHVVLSRPDGWDGHFYIVRQFIDELAGFEFWLCPALLAFLPEAPQEIFVKVMSSSIAQPHT